MISNVNSYFTDVNSDECWNISLDGYFKSCITEQLLQDDMPEDAVDTIFQNAVGTLSQCPNPNNKKPNEKTGIIIGRVQSGKTSNFLSLVALAFDNGYDITIILGGNTKNLVEQNYDRIKSTFLQASNQNHVSILSTSGSNLVKSKSIKKILDAGKKVILVGLKHHKHIKQIAEIFNDVELSNRLTLIIDDEGDQATFNTKPRTRKQEEEQKKKDSATYSAVRDLKKSLKRHCLLSVTATPQANILVDKIDFLSPDFGTLVYPGDGYCGLNEFHGVDSEKYVKIIPDEDTATLLGDNQIPPSLIKALAAFFVSGAIRQYRDGKGIKHSMLIHPEVKKDVHGAILELVEALIDEDWKERASVKKYGDDAYLPLRGHLVEAYDEYLKDGVHLPPFEVLEDDILEGISNSCLHLCNSDLNASSDAEHFSFNIFVGGNMLGRGITLPKLTVTYITRRAKGIANVDNTEQRARWFGYRNADKPYFDLCRVYATENISNDFSAILEHEEDLWQTIEEAQKNGVEFKELSRIFKLPNKLLRATRPSVNQTKFLRFSSRITQGYLTSSPSIANANDELISQFRTLHPPEIYDLGYQAEHPNFIARNLNFYDVCTELLQKYKYPNDSHLDLKYIELLSYLLKKSEEEIGTPLIDVIWVRPDIGSARNIQNGVINQLFQGKGSGYPGDRYLPDTGNIQLQIHYVRPNNYQQSPEINSKIGSPVLSLHLPVNYIMAVDRKYIAPVDEVEK